MCSYNIFRTLSADEIDVRVQQVAESGGKVRATLLLYKDARVDMDMLDEHFGCFGWQREHTFKEGKNYCKVSVYDRTNQRWICKEDVGVESNTEETKGEASDAFKRACVNFGIGRELYSAPHISVELSTNEYYRVDSNKQGKALYRISSWVKFRVASVSYNKETRTIDDLVIVDCNGNERYSLKASHVTQNAQKPKPAQRKKLTIDHLMDAAFVEKICAWLHGRSSDGKIGSVIAQYYDCDEQTERFLLNEYLRIYG